MNAWPIEDSVSMNAFYGNPDANRDGLPDTSWEGENLMRVIPPYPMVLAWDISTKVRTISIHKKCASSLARVLKRIATEMSIDDINKYQLDRYGGAYMFRLMRGATALSVHSWGAAIDLSPGINSFGTDYGHKPNMMPMSVVRMFEEEGATWGGLWRRGDAQHFQFAGIS